jgi:hypothetical protein
MCKSKFSCNFATDLIKKSNYGNSNIKEKDVPACFWLYMGKLFVNIPQSDIKFFQLFAEKMGWEIESREDLLDRFISTRPSKCSLDRR